MLSSFLKNLLFWIDKKSYQKSDEYNTIRKGVITYVDLRDIYIKGDDGKQYFHSFFHERKYTQKLVDYTNLVQGSRVSFRLSHEPPFVVDIEPLEKITTYKAKVDFINIGKIDSNFNFGNLKLEDNGKIIDFPIGYSNIHKIKSIDFSKIHNSDDCLVTIVGDKITDIKVINKSN